MSTSLRQATSLLPSPTSSNANDPISDHRHHKLARIEAAIQACDVGILRKIAGEPGGFETSPIRATVWSILLGSQTIKSTASPEQVPNITSPVPDNGVPATDNADDANANATGQSRPLPPAQQPATHRDEGQVKLDVNRSFVNYPKNITAPAKDVLRERLERVIVHTLRTFPSLRYFQGYHDIISVLLLTIEDDATLIDAADRMSLHRLRDSMGVGLEPVLGYLRLVYRIIEREDPNLAALVEMAAPLPFFSLSWVLTLMSHDLDSLAVVSRLFDFLLAYNPAMMSYLGAAVILLKKEELAMLDDDAAEDPAMLHHTLSKMPNFVMDGFPFAAAEDLPAQAEEPLGFSRAVMVSGPASVRSASDRAEEDSLMSSSVISLTEAESTTDQTVTSSAASSASSTSSLTHLTRPIDYEPDFDSSLDDFSHAVLSDPDVSGPAFTSPGRSRSRSASSSPSHVRRPSSSHRSASPGTPRSPLSPPTSIETLIESALDLWDRHPLVGDDGIDADRVMGPKSCIFTWGLSEDGLLDDAGAEAIVKEGLDIVLPEGEPEDDVGGEDEKGTRDERDTGKRPIKAWEVGRRRRRQRLWLLGTAVGVVGVGVLLAGIWGNEWRGAGAGGTGAGARSEWRWLRWAGW